MMQVGGTFKERALKVGDSEVQTRKVKGDAKVRSGVQAKGQMYLTVKSLQDFRF